MLHTKTLEGKHNSKLTVYYDDGDDAVHVWLNFHCDNTDKEYTTLTHDVNEVLETEVMHLHPHVGRGTVRLEQHEIEFIISSVEEMTTAS